MENDPLNRLHPEQAEAIPEEPRAPSVSDSEVQRLIDDDETIDDPDVLKHIQEQIRVARSAGTVATEAAVESPGSIEPTLHERFSLDSSPGASIEQVARQTPLRENPRIVEWVAESTSPEEDSRDIMTSAAKQALARESIKEVSDASQQELEHTDGAIDEARDVLTRLQKSYESIGSDVWSSKQIVNTIMTEALNRRHGDPGALLTDLRRVQQNAEGWIAAARREQLNGEDVAIFAKNMLRRSDGITYAVESTSKGLGAGLSRAQDNPEAIDDEGSANEAIDKTDAQNAEEFIKQGDAAVEGARYVFDQLGSGSTRMARASERLAAEETLVRPLESFSTMTRSVQEAFEDVQQVLRRGGSQQQLGEAGYRLKEQLEEIEHKAVTIRKIAAEHGEDVDAIGSAVSSLKQGIRSLDS